MITILQALRAYQAIEKLMDEKMSFKDAHEIVMTKKELEPHVQFYVEKEREIIEKYAVKDGEGKIMFNGKQFQLQPENASNYTAERVELDSVEIPFENKRKISVNAEIAPSVLETLMELFDFEE